MNLTELFDRTAERWPQQPAFIEGNAIVSYADLRDKIARFTSKLAALRLPPGSRIGLCFPDGSTYVALTYALWRINAAVVPIPTECTRDEAAEIAGTMQLQGLLSRTQPGQAVEGFHGPGHPGECLDSDCWFCRLDPAVPPDNHGLDIAFIRFTSGTTNARKGVVLCHETIRDRVMAVNKSLRMGTSDLVAWCLPMSHHFLVTIVLYLSHGATIVMARDALGRSFLEIANRWKVTLLYAAPFHFALLARDSSDAMLPSVRLAVSTTCGLPADVGRDFLRRFGFPVAQALGVIELGLVCVNVDDPSGRADSVGRPGSDYRVKIVDPDERGCGEILIKGPGFFDAYAAPWQSREELMSDGWFKTGDIGRLDADGFLFLAGRKTAVINLAGRKVFPEEIEAVLNRHPAVRESRVFGRRHPHLGEVIEAEVVLAQAGTDLGLVRDHCRAHLAPY